MLTKDNAERLQAGWEKAGVEYQRAVAEFWRSYCELLAVEAAAQSALIRTNDTPPIGFGPAPDPIPMIHPKWAPDIVDAGGVAHDWASKSKARELAIIDLLTKR